MTDNKEPVKVTTECGCRYLHMYGSAILTYLCKQHLLNGTVIINKSNIR